MRPEHGSRRADELRGIEGSAARSYYHAFGEAVLVDDDIFAFENGRILTAVMKLSALKLFNAFDAERARLEGTHAGCDDHDFAVELAA